MTEVTVAVCSLVVAVVGLLVAMLAIRFAARQAAAAAEQVRTGNGFAGVSTTFGVFGLLHPLLRVFVDHPDLYPYFYQGKPVPRRGKDRVRVQVMAEMLADALSSALQMTGQIPSAKDGLSSWSLYVVHMLDTCGPLQEAMRRYPGWWPHLEELASSRTAGGRPAAPVPPVS
ncbi:hypothetical protein [Planobispora takensis]|uniref:hypothetical protein n=1 Tax=Planobispora takensis TaxID=1367882 RepID=UPI001940FE2F|nr:hypothetical protein [Planobispora takensis]